MRIASAVANLRSEPSHIVETSATKPITRAPTRATASSMSSWVRMSPLSPSRDSPVMTVLPEASLRQAPLSSIEEKPMRRASRSQLEQLIALEHGAG